MFVLLLWHSVKLYADAGSLNEREKKTQLCTSANKDYPVFVLGCCYGSAYGFIWWKFVVRWKEVTCMRDKQEVAAKLQINTETERGVADDTWNQEKTGIGVLLPVSVNWQQKCAHAVSCQSQRPLGQCHSCNDAFTACASCPPWLCVLWHILLLLFWKQNSTALAWSHH